MAFFNKLNNAARTAAKTAAEMANDAIGTGRITMKIKKEELAVSEQYERIGKYFYQQRNGGMEMPAAIEECCVAIDIALATIKELQEARDELRDVPEVSFEEEIPYEAESRVIPVCPACNREVAYGMLFCPACGAKLPEA